MATLSIRVDLSPHARIGPGKIALLEGIAAHGSIAAAGRAMGMSYRRAWELVAELNGLFTTPLVTPHVGGTRGGGAQLTELGRTLTDSYRAAEQAATRAALAHFAPLNSLLACDA